MTGASEHVFLHESDVQKILNASGAIKGNNISSIHLKETEEALKKNQWIKDAQLYIDNNQVLFVNIYEREPIARIFHIAGKFFFI